MSEPAAAAVGGIQIIGNQELRLYDFRNHSLGDTHPPFDHERLPAEMKYRTETVGAESGMGLYP